MKQNSRISSMPWLAFHSVSWPRLDTHGVCPTSRRQGADFLVSLMAPLHRQYKNRANRNSPASAIENKADANSDIGFARLCFVQRCHKGTHTKVLKLSAGLRTQSVECSKLGKTRIITDASCGMVRNTGFCGQNLPPHGYLELLSIYCS